jgi:peptide/bleomycin uptake transporter
MFRSFFLNRKWFFWAWIISVVILGATQYQVNLNVEINEWFGSFYDLIQRALSEPGSVTFSEYMRELMTFLYIAAIFVVVAVILDFITKHFVFRWRTAMNDYYMAHWHVVRHIEGPPNAFRKIPCALRGSWRASASHSCAPL